jgi:methylated-DNA-[protein]-cysteine S-methyltransferase
MATNPIPIIIPCHRIVTASKGRHAMGGYSGGDGLPTKLFLLALEQRMAPTGTTQPRLDLQ